MLAGCTRPRRSTPPISLIRAGGGCAGGPACLRGWRGLRRGFPLRLRRGVTLPVRGGSLCQVRNFRTCLKVATNSPHCLVARARSPGVLPVTELRVRHTPSNCRTMFRWTGVAETHSHFPAPRNPGPSPQAVTTPTGAMHVTRIGAIWCWKPYPRRTLFLIPTATPFPHDNGMIGACVNTRNRAFINPDAPAFSIRAAVKMCQGCPLRRDCAEQALHAGDLMDGSWTRAASGVVQAGVVCRGDKATAQALAEIAGVKPPRYRDSQRKRLAPDHCSNCHRPMKPWTRGDVPEGYVMHRGRGICVNCRSAYTEYLEEHGRTRKGLHKRADRSSSVAAMRTRRERWEQQPDVAAVLAQEPDADRTQAVYALIADMPMMGKAPSCYVCGIGLVYRGVKPGPGEASTAGKGICTGCRHGYKAWRRTHRAPGA